MKTRRHKALLALFFWLTLTNTRADTTEIDTKPQKLTFPEQQLQIDVELAVNQAARETGLMHRNKLPPKSGMLFVFPVSAIQRVWMKNTLLPLDILFLTADGRIASIQENLQPCVHEPCPIFDSGLPTKFMLEVNAHFVKIHNLKIGQVLKLPTVVDGFPSLQ